jgi:hypothetical protein
MRVLQSVRDEDAGGALNVMEYLRASTPFLSWNQFSVLKNSFQSMSTGSLLRAHPASRSISALTTKLLKEGTTIETLGGVMDPEVRSDTLCCQFLKFFSG